MDLPPTTRSEASRDHEGAQHVFRLFLIAHLPTTHKITHHPSHTRRLAKKDGCCLQAIHKPSAGSQDKLWDGSHLIIAAAAAVMLPCIPCNFCTGHGKSISSLWQEQSLTTTILNLDDHDHCAVQAANCITPCNNAIIWLLACLSRLTCKQGTSLVLCLGTGFPCKVLSLVLCLSAGFPCKVLSLSTKLEVCRAVLQGATSSDKRTLPAVAAQAVI
jgi:hypothetical protein